MTSTQLHWIGAGLFIAGYSLIVRAAYLNGRDDARAETVWTEADKSVIGETNATSG